MYTFSLSLEVRKGQNSEDWAKGGWEHSFHKWELAETWHAYIHTHPDDTRKVSRCLECWGMGKMM
jgi:hypothetical protein